MAKRLLLNALLNVLGEFIELDEENLNLAVWSGQIVLKNLRLKTEKLLRDFNFEVYHGLIKKLEITIPWTTLLLNPVKIEIDGILLDVGPLDVSKLNRLERIQRFLEEKFQKLKMVDQYIGLSLSIDDKGKSTLTGDDGSSESYMQKWTTNMVDNIEIKATNLHVRYEDCLSVPDRVFAAGIILESFGISTLDENWGEGEKSTSSSNSTASNGGEDSTHSGSNGSNHGAKYNSNASSVYKLAYMNSLGVYWQSVTSPISNAPIEIWEKIMLNMIHISSGSATGATVDQLAAEHRQGLAHPNYMRKNLSKDGGLSSFATGNASIVIPPSPTSARSGGDDTTVRSNTSSNISSNSNASNSDFTILPRDAFILHPYNNKLSLKLIHTRKPTATIPKFDVMAASGNLQVSFDSEQYKQMFSIIDRINNLGKVHLPFGYRPRERPVAPDLAQAWWRYGVKLVLKERRYIELVKKGMLPAALGKAPATSSTGGGTSSPRPRPATTSTSGTGVGAVSKRSTSAADSNDPLELHSLSDAEQQELRNLEERLPIEPLRLFRQRALAAVAEEVQKQQAANKLASDASGAAAGSWWWWSTEAAGTPVVAAAVAGTGASGAKASGEDAAVPATAAGAGTDISISSIINALNETDAEVEGAGQRGSRKGAGKSSSSTGSKAASGPWAAQSQQRAQAPFKSGAAGSDSIADMVLVKCSLSSSSRLTISCSSVPIVQSDTSVSLSFSQTLDGIKLQCMLDDLSVEDKFTPHPAIPYLISVKKSVREEQRQQQRSVSGRTADSSHRPVGSGVAPSTCSVEFARRDGKSKLVINALPIEVSLNKDCIHKLVNEFARPENIYLAAKRRRLRRHRDKKLAARDGGCPTSAADGGGRGGGGCGGGRGAVSGSRGGGAAAGHPDRRSTMKRQQSTSQAWGQMMAPSSSATSADAFEIIFEANAPKIIIPENCSEDVGYLLLDTGYLVMRGLLSSSGVSLDVSLNNVNSGLPMLLEDMYRIGEKALYLIKVSHVISYYYRD